MKLSLADDVPPQLVKLHDKVPVAPVLFLMILTRNGICAEGEGDSVPKKDVPAGVENVQLDVEFGPTDPDCAVPSGLSVPWP